MAQRRTAPEAAGKIRELMKAYDLTAAEFAGMIGMSYGNLYRILTGHHDAPWAVGQLVEQMTEAWKANPPEPTMFRGRPRGGRAAQRVPRNSER